MAQIGKKGELNKMSKKIHLYHINYIYHCKQCGDRYNLEGYETDDPYDLAHLAEKMFCLHQCRTGIVGIAELVGIESIEDRHS
jgi:hypothetical protein